MQFNGKIVGPLKIVKEGGVFVRIPAEADKFGIGAAAGYYFRLKGQWYFGVKPEIHCIDVCDAHVRDLEKRLRDGKIYDI